MGFPVDRWFCFFFVLWVVVVGWLVVDVGLVPVVLFRFLFLQIGLKNKDFDCLHLLNSRADEP